MKVCPKCKGYYSDEDTVCNMCGTPLIDNKIYQQQLNVQNYIDDSPQPVYTPHCPTCGSNNIEKISGANKVGKAVLFGIFATGSISKTFHCKNCGYRW